MRKRIAIIYNPTAGQFRARRLNQIIEALKGEGAEVEAYPTLHRGHGTEIARGIQHFDLVAAMGGDGTVREVAQGLVGRQVPLGLIPGGSANVLARDFGLFGLSPSLLASALVHGQLRPFHMAGPMAVMAGAGYDGRTVHLMDLALKRRVGRLAYVWAGLRAIFSSAAPDLILKVNEGSEIKAQWVLITKGPHYAGPFRLGPGLDPHADHLTAFALVKGGHLLLLAALCLLPFNLFHRAPGVVRVSGKRIRVAATKPGLIEVDGDPWGEAVLEVAIGDTPILAVSLSNP